MVALPQILRSQLRNIPIQWMVMFPFVVQLIGCIGIIVTSSYQYWTICICGILILFAGIFAIWANQCISQKIGSLELNLQQVQEKYRILFEALPIGTTITESALRQIESRLQAFLDNAPTPISIKDLEGTYLSVNPEFAYLMNLSEEQILGKRDYDLFEFQSVKRFRDMELQAIFEGIAVNFEETLKFPDQLRTFIITKFPIMDAHDKPYAVAGIYLDISDRKNTEANLRKTNQELEHLINLDALTQIANRRCFNERIITEWQRLHREQQPLSLLMFDVDYFKRYNDLYGHQLGDECLIKIAQAVDHLMHRSGDLVARYGGEEFIVILPNTNLEGATIVAERIHQAIRELQIPHQDSNVSNIVSVSVGITSEIPSSDCSPYDFIHQADHALYDAKQQGRNCSVVFTSST